MNTFTLPRECVLAVPLTAPQQGALSICALVVLGLVGSTKLMSHCHVWVSDKTGNLISSGFVKKRLYPVFKSVTCMCLILKFCFHCILCNILYLYHVTQYSLCDKCADCLASFYHFYNNPFISTLFLRLIYDDCSNSIHTHTHIHNLYI